MASLNKVQIIGHLGQDPTTRYLPNGDAVTNISVATSEKWKDKTTGEDKEQTEWFRVTLWRRLGEIAGEYLKKGSQVYIEGKLHTRKWTDKDNIERYTTEITADQMVMLGGKNEGGERPARPAASESKRTPAGEKQRTGGKFDDMDDDIPFASCALRDDVIFTKLRHTIE